MAYNQFDIPIFQKTYDFYKMIHVCRSEIPKMERYTVWQKIEIICIEMIENLLTVKYFSGSDKMDFLNKISVKVDMLRIFIRLANETKALNNKKYIALQEVLDEIGRMLGGWIKNCHKK